MDEGEDNIGYRPALIADAAVDLALSPTDVLGVITRAFVAPFGFGLGAMMWFALPETVSRHKPLAQ